MPDLTEDAVRELIELAVMFENAPASAVSPEQADEYERLRDELSHPLADSWLAQRELLREALRAICCMDERATALAVALQRVFREDTVTCMGEGDLSEAMGARSVDEMRVQHQAWAAAIEAHLNPSDAEGGDASP